MTAIDVLLGVALLCLLLALLGMVADRWEEATRDSREARRRNRQPTWRR